MKQEKEGSDNKGKHSVSTKPTRAQGNSSGSANARGGSRQGNAGHVGEQDGAQGNR